MWRRVLAVVLAVIAVFGFTYMRNRQEEKPEKNEVGNAMTWTPPELEEIWNIEEKVNFVVEMGSYTARKCEYGDSMLALTHAERVVYIVYTLEGEVNNGGFLQYFWNSSGNQANELVDAFLEIGAPKTAAICEKALSVFGGHVPEDWDERNEVLDELDSDMVDEILSECDDAFYDYEENLTELCYEYITKNKDQFH